MNTTDCHPPELIDVLITGDGPKLLLKPVGELLSISELYFAMRRIEQSDKRPFSLDLPPCCNGMVCYCTTGARADSAMECEKLVFVDVAFKHLVQ